MNIKTKEASSLLVAVLAALMVLFMVQNLQSVTVALFASLDHLSKGRAGWNLVTSAGDATARNFGLDKQRPPPGQQLRARDPMPSSRR